MPPRNLTRTAATSAIARSTVVLGAGAITWWSIDRGKQFRDDVDVKVQAAPLVGEWEWMPSWLLLIPLVVGIAVLVLLPRLAGGAQRRPFWLLAASSAALAGLFAVTLAASHGWGAVMEPVVHPSEYWHNLDTLPPISDMLRSWSSVDFLLDYSVHLKGHPPGFVLILKWLELAGLGAPWVTAALCWLGIIAMVPAVMICVREIATEAAALRCAPFLVLAPYAVWSATSADAFFAAVLFWGTACLLLALHQDLAGWRKWSLSIGGGALLCCGLFLTYGAAVYLPIPLLFVLFAHRPRDPAAPPGGLTWKMRVKLLAGAAAGASLVTASFAAAGFWWFDGLATTQKFYVWGTAQFRPWQYFIVANIGALIIAVGPAVVVGLASLAGNTAGNAAGHRVVGVAPRLPQLKHLWLVVGSAALCVAAANVSGMSKAEVERIWLIFMPLLMPATAALRRPRLWLMLQLALALFLQAALVTKW